MGLYGNLHRKCVSKLDRMIYQTVTSSFIMEVIALDKEKLINGAPNWRYCLLRYNNMVAFTFPSRLLNVLKIVIL